MRRSTTTHSVSPLFALVVAAAVLPVETSAQLSIDLSAGATFPAGAYGDVVKTGGIALAGIRAPLGDAGLAVGATGYFGTNGHEGPNQDRTNLYGALVTAGFVFPAQGSILPIVFAGLGFMTRAYRSDTYPDLSARAFGLAYGGGAGVMFPLGSINGRVQGTYLMGSGDVDGTQLFAVSAGVSIPLPGGA